MVSLVKVTISLFLSTPLFCSVKCGSAFEKTRTRRPREATLPPTLLLAVNQIHRVSDEDGKGDEAQDGVEKA